MSGEPEPRPFTASVHFAIEGDGFFAKLQRSMFSALAAVMAQQLHFVVHATAEQALTAVAAERQLDAEALRSAARAGGIIAS